MSTQLSPLREGRWAVVTGGSSGIGRAHAVELAARGFDLVLVGRDAERLQSTRVAISTEHSVSVETVQLDLAEADAATELLRVLGDREIGVFTAVAGSGSPGDFVEGDLATFLECVNLKVRTNLILLHAIARAMSARGSGAIIIVSSTGALQGVPQLANNAGTEAYLLAMAEALHHELAPHGVKVLGLMPGMTKTPGLSAMVAESDIPRTAQTPQQVAQESLAATEAGRVSHVSGLPNRIVLRALPRRARTAFFARMISGVMKSSTVTAT